MNKFLEERNAGIRSDIYNCIGILVSASYNDAAGVLVTDAYKYIAKRIQYDCIDINSEAIIRGFCRYINCSTAEFISVLNKYIKNHEELIRRCMLTDKLPSAVELIDFILEKHLEGIYAEIVKRQNSMRVSFATMLFDPVIRQWQNKWEDMCPFRARLYDIYNNIAAESEYVTKKEAFSFISSRTERKPEAYSRYVILIKTPFCREDVIYTVKGILSSKNICRTRGGIRGWSAHFYDYRDRDFSSVVSPDYMTPKEIKKHCLDKGALYFVLTYCDDPKRGFTVQYSKTAGTFDCPDVVSVIDKYFFENL